jgi:hypothetical protein
MSGDALLGPAALLGAVAVGVLRYAWSLPHRSAAWNGLGWVALLGSVAAGWASAGAWGVSVAGLATIAVAFVALAIASTEASNTPSRPSNRRVNMLPQDGEPRRIGRRVVTFLLVIPAAMLVSIALAVATRGLGGLLGWDEANAIVVALYVVPLGWAVLATILLMQSRRSSQLITLAACTLAATPFLLGAGS